MYEVEVKIEAAHPPVRERLDALGAEPLGWVRQRDTYYDHPARAFAETDEALRLRLETAGDGERPGAGGEEPAESPAPLEAETAVLTYKGPREDDGAKTREELETDVGDPEAADALVRALGFEAAATVEKVRERFALGEYTVALDCVAGLGEFVEVEGEGDHDDVEALREGAIERCRALGLDPAEATSAAYLELLLGSA